MSRRITWSKDGTWVTGGQLPTTVHAQNLTYNNNVDCAEWIYATGVHVGTWFSNYADYIIFNFPDYVTLDEIRWSISSRNNSGPTVFRFEVCPTGDTSNGIDGTWNTVAADTSMTATYVNKVVALTPTSTRYFRIAALNGYDHRRFDVTFAYLSLYGSYDVEDFVLWDDEVSAAPITDWTDFLTLPNAPDHEDFTPPTKKFKIQNVGLIPHTYTITLQSGVPSFADPLILDNWTASKDGGATTGLSVQTSEVAVGSFSEVIDLEYFLTAIANPKDGFHFFRVLVKEDII